LLLHQLTNNARAHDRQPCFNLLLDLFSDENEDNKADVSIAKPQQRASKQRNGHVAPAAEQQLPASTAPQQGSSSAPEDSSPAESTLLQPNGSSSSSRIAVAAAAKPQRSSKASKSSNSSSKAAAGGPSRAAEQAMWAQGYKAVAGVDEAGRGPLAGPVVAAAAVLPEGLDFAGLNDSKQMTEEGREELFEQLTSHPDVLWAV
jgi:hypothetical protein